VFEQKVQPLIAKFDSYVPALPNFSSVNTARSLQVSNTRPRHSTCCKALGAVGALNTTTPVTVYVEANVSLLIGTADWALEFCSSRPSLPPPLPQKMDIHFRNSVYYVPSL
jgi:hypothetical protein